jgi:hypothetical protein
VKISSNSISTILTIRKIVECGFFRRQMFVFLFNGGIYSVQKNIIDNEGEVKKANRRPAIWPTKSNGKKQGGKEVEREIR